MNTSRKFYIQNYLNKDSKSYNVIVIALLLLCLFLTIILSIMIGSIKLTPEDIITALTRGDTNSHIYQIINYVRIPRTLAAVMAGSALSISGLILQSVLNNSLASPNVIGVNAGAGLATVLVAALFPAFYYYSILAAFLGALAAVLFIYLLSLKTSASRMTLILSGIAVTSFLGAITDTLLTLYPDTVMKRQAFLIGGFSGVTMKQLGFAVVSILIALCLTFFLSYAMNLLSLGEETAKSLGLSVSFYRLLLLFLAAILAGSAISFSGLLGFIGLIIPHCARFFVGHNNKILIPVAALMGSFFTLVCDLLARVVFAPYEIPVGIVLSFLGGPFFIYLLRKKRGSLYD